MSIQLRWFRLDQLEFGPDGLGMPRTKEGTPVLQFREEEGDPRGEQWWGDWQDVPLEVEEK